MTHDHTDHDATESAAHAIESARKPNLRTIIFQIVAFALSIALVVWAVRIALDKGSPEQFDRLASPAIGPLALLLAATAASIAVNGLIFWVLVKPIKKLSPGELIAVNAIGTFLVVLPFKLSLLSRVAIHTKRDNIALKDLVSWFCALGAVSLAVLIPLAGVSLWRQQPDAIWALSGFILVPAACVFVIEVNRFLQRSDRFRPIGLGAERILTQRALVAKAGVLRAIDVALLAARFAAAAHIAGIELDAGSAVVLGSTFFLISLLSPTGSTGFQLGGAIAIGAWESMPQEEAALLTLAVAISEFVVAFVMAGIGAAILRLDKLFR